MMLRDPSIKKNTHPLNQTAFDSGSVQILETAHQKEFGAYSNDEELSAEEQSGVR